MIRYNGMLHYPVWLIEVEEDLFLISFFQQYQSTRMMLPHWNTNHRTQWIEEKWDLTLQMIWQHGMLYHPVWLIEVEEDLFITPFFQLYQSTRMMMLHLSILFYFHRRYHWNTTDQTQWIEEKWDLTLQMIWYSGMLHHPVWLIEVEEDLFLNSFNSVLPIKANELVELKQFSPISTVSSASNSVNSNDVADWNALLLILNDLSDFISTPLFQRLMVTLYYNRRSIVECIISKCHRTKRRKICSQSQSHFPPCRTNGAW